MKQCLLDEAKEKAIPLLIALKNGEKISVQEAIKL
jgi:hypothetical protein